MNSKSAPGPHSFDKLFRDLYRRLYYSVSKLTNDRDLLNFVVSGSIHEYYQKGHDLSSDAVIRQLFVAVKHRALDALGKKKTRERIDKRWVLENMPTAEDPFVHRDMIATELMQKVVKVMEKLPRRYREAVEGYYLKGIPAKDLARIMGIQVSSVHRLKDLGIERLIKLLNERDLLVWFIYIFLLLSRDNWKN